MTHCPKNQEFVSRYTLEDFIKDLMKEVFFSLIIISVYKIGQILVNRYKPSMMEIMIYILLTLDGNHVIRNIEWMLLGLLPNNLNRLDKVQERLLRGWFFYLAQKLNPNLHKIISNWMGYKDSRFHRLHGKVYPIDRCGRLFSTGYRIRCAFSSER